uniref:Secreted protein n=1 Tax=Panagrellus redivivus TaxID=6233 RepID=A0A7E4UT60_PANRE
MIIYLRCNLSLTAGVAGGLVCVVVALYLYKFCAGHKTDDDLKQPHKRCDLPPTVMQYSTQAATNPLYQHFVPSDHLNEQEVKGFNVLIDLANDTKKIAQVFPLMNQSTENEPPDFAGSMPSTLGRSPHEQQHQSRAHSPINGGSEHFNHNWAHLSKPKTSLRPGDQNGPSQHHPRSGSFNVSCAWNPDNFTENRIMQSNKSNSNSQPMVASPREKAPLSAFLSVQPTQPFRTHSAEMLTPQMDTEELRRASFDVAGGYRRPGTGRKLPSTERFENPNSSVSQFQFQVQ